MSIWQLLLQTVLLVVGFVMLIKGADWFVDGAASLAAKFGIPQLVIGLTIVAMGTSAPEAAVSISAALQKNAGITIGNVVGSNIMNVLVILGLASVIIPIAVKKSTVRYEIPFTIFVTVVLAVLGLWDNKISRLEGGILWILFVVYLAYLFVMTKKGDTEAEENESKLDKVWKMVVFILIVLVVLVLLIVLFVIHCNHLRKYSFAHLRKTIRRLRGKNMLLIKNANLYTMESEEPINSDLFVSNGKIAEIGKNIELTADETADAYLLTVKDVGNGIPADHIALVTEPFYRVDKARSRQQGGAGLGLTLCQMIAQAHHGSLHIESAEGTGTCITVTLPKEDDHE